MSQSGMISEFVHRSRRGAELFLLVLALIIGVGRVRRGRARRRRRGPGRHHRLRRLAGRPRVVCHIVVRLVAPYADPVLLPVVAALNGLGLAMIHRLDLGRRSDDRTHSPTQQLIWTALGVGAVRR